MKNILKSIMCIAVLFLSSCDTESTGDVSFVTNYAVFEYDNLAVVALNGTFTPSAVATENGATLEVTSGGNVDTSTVGIYDVSYSATNSDGFAATVFQTVIVHDPSIVGSDIAGNIQDTTRNERTGIITLVPGTTSIFHCTDFGFGGNFPMYFQMDGDTISEIPQTYPFSATSVALTYDPATRMFTTLIQPYGFDYTFEYQ